MQKAQWSRPEEIMKLCLCPPGSGVHTVHTAQEIKDSLQQKLYGKTGDEARDKWLASLDNLTATSTVLLGITSDNGGGILRGANWGPLFVRRHLLDLPVVPGVLDIGDVRTIPHFLQDELLNEETIKRSRKALYGKADISLPVSPLSITQEVVKAIYAQDPHKKIMGLGGDHSVSYPLVKEYLANQKRLGRRPALIHFDAHTDLLPERLGVPICFGSWTYHILPELISPSHLVQIGIRSTGKDKNYWESTLGLRQYWAHEVINRPQALAREIIAHLEREKIDELYVSFDIDALDAFYASATGTPEKEGIRPHEAKLILEELSNRFKIGGADLVEVAPFVSYNEGHRPMESGGAQTTLNMAASLSHYLLHCLTK